MHRAGRSHDNADGLSRRPKQPEKGRSSDSSDPEIKSTESQSPEEVEEDITCFRPEENHRVAAVTVQLLWTNEEWKELQKEDPDIAPIWTRLAKGEEKPRCNEMFEFSLATKAYWGEWQRLVMRYGVIYRKRVLMECKFTPKRWFRLASGKRSSNKPTVKDGQLI